VEFTQRVILNFISSNRVSIPIDDGRSLGCDSQHLHIKFFTAGKMYAVMTDSIIEQSDSVSLISSKFQIMCCSQI
jgi:hypothetical protein